MGVTVELIGDVGGSRGCGGCAEVVVGVVTEFMSAHCGSGDKEEPEVASVGSCWPPYVGVDRS